MIYLVNFDACKLQSYPHSPGAGGAEVRVELWPGDDDYQDDHDHDNDGNDVVYDDYDVEN